MQVAGTNGKGSTCRYLHRILSRRGLKTGLFTSPHLVCVRERFLLDEEAIAEDEFADLVEEILPHAEATGATYFEMLTAMAALWYPRRGTNALVLETGLGGRLDSTTAFPAEVCAVTQVGLDHVAILGDTVEKIWREKIAILRPGKPLATMESRPHLLAELAGLARARGGRIVTPDRSREREFPGLPAGLHQPANLLLARTCAEELLGTEIDDEEIRSALEGMRWPGRLERIPGDPEFWVDVGHNPDAALAVLPEATRLRPVLLYGTMADKDWKAVLSTLFPAVESVVLAPLDLPRAESPEAIAARFPGCLAAASFDDAMRAAIGSARARGCPVLACGSFHLAGGVLRRLGEAGRYRFWPDGIRPDPRIPAMG